jgi:cell division protein FtsA
MVDLLENTAWYKELPFTRKPTIHHIQPQQVVGIIDRTGTVTDHTFITAMGLLRVGLDTIGQGDSTQTGTIRQKLDRMLKV